MKQAELFGDVLTDLANGPHLGGHDGLTEALMRRLNEKGMSLKEMGGSRIMARSEGTMRKWARAFSLVFDDYTPMKLRPKRIAAKKRRLKADPLAYYRDIVEANPGLLILMRWGDFYEAFDAGAALLADDLGLVLTKRGEAPMCGIPVHAAEDYLKRLARAGRRVAICEPRHG